jgi:tetratricopeptide (TPR) repeat protein
MNRIEKTKRTFLSAVLLIAGGFSHLFADTPDPKIVQETNICIDLVFAEKFADAHIAANEVIRRYPDSPAGYFLRGAIYHYQMLYLRKNTFEQQLYEACNKGVQIGERNKGKDKWNDFFLAATIGVQGSFERVNGRLVSSLKLATRAIEIFRTMNEEEVKDVLYGVGVYDYWIGANVRLLWWMPGARDNRPEALTNLERMKAEGFFTRIVVNYDLMEMYLNEKRYQKVVQIASSVLDKYPANSIALWALYEAYNALKKEDERNAVALRISVRISNEKDNVEQMKYYEKKIRRNS